MPVCVCVCVCVCQCMVFITSMSTPRWCYAITNQCPDSLLCGEGFILQQDNEPKRTSKLLQNYLETKGGKEVLTVIDIYGDEAGILRHHRKLCGTLSNQAGIT